MRTAPDVVDVAAYILGKLGSMTTMKLQKLVYYSQAWHLAWTGRPLFDNRIEAWRNGPVTPDLFDLHRGLYSITALSAGEAGHLGPEHRSTVDAVLKAYGGLEASQLSALTHGERPWVEAWSRGGRVITTKAMREYYGGLRDSETLVEEIDWSDW